MFSEKFFNFYIPKRYWSSETECFPTSTCFFCGNVHFGKKVIFLQKGNMTISVTVSTLPIYDCFCHVSLVLLIQTGLWVSWNRLAAKYCTLSAGKYEHLFLG